MATLKALRAALALVSSPVLAFGLRLGVSASAEIDQALRIKATFANMEESLARRQCMFDQLQQIQSKATASGVHFSFERTPAIGFGSCYDAESCMLERPECFPSGRAAYIHHGTYAKDDLDGRARAARGVLGNWCSHLMILNQLVKEAEYFDYFLVFEDDSICMPDFTETLLSFLRSYPAHWQLVAIDTFNGGAEVEFPQEDVIATLPTGMLYSMSRSRNTYWGAHAWLLNAKYISRLSSVYSELPAIPVDYFAKARHPAHVAMWALQVGIVKQEIRLDESAKDTMPKSCLAVSGSDINGNGQADKIVSMRFVSEQIVDSRRRSASRIVAMAMPHAGSRMIAHLLSANLKLPVQWTEAHPDRFAEFGQLGDTSDAVAVVVVRHPFGVLQRFRDPSADYCGVGCGNLRGAQGITAACNWSAAQPGAVGEALGHPVDATCLSSMPTDPCWPSAPEAWNSYMRSYESEAFFKLFQQVIVLRYEDVLDEPLTALQEVDLVLGGGARLDIGSLERVPMSFADSTPNSVESDYGAHFECEELQAICEKLDTARLFKLGYHGCQRSSEAFDQLIYNASAYKNLTGPWQVPARPEGLC